MKKNAREKRERSEVKREKEKLLKRLNFQVSERVTLSSEDYISAALYYFPAWRTTSRLLCELPLGTNTTNNTHRACERAKKVIYWLLVVIWMSFEQEQSCSLDLFARLSSSSSSSSFSCRFSFFLSLISFCLNTRLKSREGKKGPLSWTMESEKSRRQLSSCASVATAAAAAHEASGARAAFWANKSLSLHQRTILAANYFFSFCCCCCCCVVLVYARAPSALAAAASLGFTNRAQQQQQQ